MHGQTEECLLQVNISSNVHCCTGELFFAVSQCYPCLALCYKPSQCQVFDRFFYHHKFYAGSMFIMFYVHNFRLGQFWYLWLVLNPIGVNLSKILGGSLPSSSHCLPLPSPSSFICS